MPPLPDPDLDEFRAALRRRADRVALGIRLSDEDAALLLDRDDWAETHWRQWRGEVVVADRGAPIALPRAVALAPVLAVPERAVVPILDDAPPAPWWRSGHPVRAGVVAAAVGSVLAATLVLVTVPQRTADAASGSPGTAAASDPFPAGLDAGAGSAPVPTASAAPEAPRERLADDVSAALRLDERTAGAPAVSGIVRKEVARIADVACLGGYDDATAERVATAVAGRPDLDRAAGNAVADAIARYCAATTG